MASESKILQTKGQTALLQAYGKQIYALGIYPHRG